MPYLDPAVDPYNPNVPDLEPQTPPMDEIIRKAFQGMMLGVKICLPALVTKVNGNQNVDVQPLLQFRYINQGPGTLATTMPQIQQVPVSMPMGQTYSIKLPVAAGDTGYIIVSDRSLDAWLASSGALPVDPQDSRQHDISDAIFVPGLIPFSKQTTDLTTDIVITNGIAKLNVQKTGMFKLSNGTVELIDLLTQITTQVKTLSQTLSTDTVNTLLGPMPLNSFAVYATIAIQLNALLVELQTLKGT